MAKFRGIMAPVTTPLDEGKKIIWSEFETHIEKLLDAGVHAILTPSGTGEFANLTWETRAELTAHAAQAIRGRVPLVSMISDCSTENVLALARLAKEAGADAAMLTPPYFSHIGQRAIRNFYTQVADRCGMPLWIYHQPGETKLTIELETLEVLSRHPNIVGVKIAPGEDFLYFTKAVRAFRGNDAFSLLNGEDFDLLASLLLGGDGGVSTLANIMPREVVGMYEAAQQGDWESARALHDRIMDAFDCAIDVQTGNYQSAVKAVLAARGLYSTNLVSDPFLPILPEEREQVVARAGELGLI